MKHLIIFHKTQTTQTLDDLFTQSDIKHNKQNLRINGVPYTVDVNTMPASDRIKNIILTTDKLVFPRELAEQKQAIVDWFSPDQPKPYIYMDWHEVDPLTVDLYE